MARKDEMTIFLEHVAAMPESAAREALESLPEAFQRAGRARMKVIREQLLQIDGLNDGTKVALANLMAARTRKAFRLTCSNADGEATVKVLALGQELGAITQRKQHYGLVLSYLGKHPDGAYGQAFAGLLQQGAQAVGRLAVLMELERVAGPNIAAVYGARLIDVEFDAKAAIEHILAPQEATFKIVDQECLSAEALAFHTAYCDQMPKGLAQAIAARGQSEGDR